MPKPANDNRELLLPQISVNGTSKAELIRQFLDIYKTLNRAIEAMDAAAPHGRDYQLKPEMLPLATAEWSNDRIVLVTLRNAYEAKLEAIA